MIRREVHGALGTRPWVVDIITRRWSGESRGIGTPSVSILRLDPNPMLIRNTHDSMGPGGREGSGDARLSGVSLRYSEVELTGSADEQTEVAYRVRDTRSPSQAAQIEGGKGSFFADQWFVLAADPIPRRGDKRGDCSDWLISLKESSAMTLFDGVDAP